MGPHRRANDRPQRRVCRPLHKVRGLNVRRRRDGGLNGGLVRLWRMQMADRIAETGQQCGGRLAAGTDRAIAARTTEQRSRGGFGNDPQAHRNRHGYEHGPLTTTICLTNTHHLIIG